MMIDTIAKRKMSLNGEDYAKGDTVPMPLQQFETDLGPNGLDWVERPADPPKETKSSKKGD